MAAIERRHWVATDDPRKVVADAAAPCFGSVLAERSLMPGDGARLGAIRFDAWLQQPPKEAAQSPRGDSDAGTPQGAAGTR